MFSLPQHYLLVIKCSYHIQTIEVKLQERDFLLSLHLVRKKQISAFLIIGNFFALLTDNICDNALDLDDGSLIIDVYFQAHGTYCQWLISAQYNQDFVTLEFQNFNVRNTIAL